MKKIAALIGVSVLAAGAADAAIVNYTLARVEYQNSFTGVTPYVVGGALAGVCTGCGTSTATWDNVTDAVTVTGAAWSVNSTSGSPTVYSTSFDGTGTKDNVNFSSLSRTSVSCINTLGTFCTGNFAGFGNDGWMQGKAADGTTACTLYCESSIWDGGTGGTELWIERKMRLSETSTFFQTYRLVYTQVPVPGAVWMFGSALGLLGLRRKIAK